MLLVFLFLVPFKPDSPVFAPEVLGSFMDYLAALPGQLYLLIKALMPWVPLGVLASLALARRWLSLGPVLLGSLLLVGLIPMAEVTVGQVLEAVWAISGVSLGVWLGVRSGLAFSLAAPRAAELPDQSAEAAEEVSPQGRSHAGKRSTTRTAPAWGRWTLAAGLALFAAYILVDLPLWGGIFAGALAVYAVLLWRFPGIWLVIVPFALPLLDIAPWSGRYFLDELDALLLVTAALVFAQAPAGRLLSGFRAWPLVLLFLAALGVSALQGLGGLPVWDANAVAAYWSPYNSLRVLKGLVWGGVIFLLILWTRPDSARLARLSLLGMGLGLLGVGLVGLWERWLFAGFADADHTYRIVSTFSSMHTGGGHIEAYLAAAVPFLWLGFARRWTLPFAAAVMALTVYVTIFTVARGGVLALGVVFVVLALASVREAWRTGKRMQAALPISILALLASGMLAGISGGYFQQRLEKSAEDWDIRMNHWTLAISMMDSTPMAQLFGMGLGSFPRVYLERGPLDQQPATFGFVYENGNTWLRLGSGDTLYYAQRVAVKAGEGYRVELDVRVGQAGRGQVAAATEKLDTPVCEKQLLNSRNCVWISHTVPADGRWHRLSQDFNSGKVGGESGLERPPVELFLYYPGKGGVVDVDNVRLLDAQGRNLLGNGGFTWAGDYWFFKTHSHLPWHIKNVWVHVLFEMGWVGLLLFTALVLLAFTRLARKAWAGQPLAWVWLASLSGILTVGLFDSLLDAPRLAILLVGLILLGLGYDFGGAVRGKVGKAVRRAFTRPAGSAGVDTRVH